MSAFAQVVGAELFKARRKRRTYVLAGLWWLLLPIVTLIVARVIQVNVSGSFVDESVGGVAGVLQEIASPYGLTRIGLTGPAYVSPTFYMIVVALLAALFVGEEKSLNMWKTTLVAQPSRLAVLWGKIAAIMIVLGVLMVGALGSGVLAGAVGMLFLPTTFAGDWAGIVGLYATQWALLLGAVLFASLLIFLARNISLGIVSVFFLPALVEGLYTLIRTTVGFEPVNRLNAVFQALRLRQTLEDLPRYFFTNNLYLPARLPARDLIETFAAGDDLQEAPFASIFGAGLTLPHAAVVMAVYAAVFGLLLTVLFLRRDVD